MKSRRKPNVGAALLACGLTAGLFCAFDARAQSRESDQAPPVASFEVEPSPAIERPFIAPDLPEPLLGNIQLSNQWFTLRIGASVIVDYTAFHQDAANVSQVEEQKDQWDARELRLTLRGTAGQDYKVNYYFTGEYHGFDGDPGKRWSFVDAWLSFPLGTPATLLTVGKTTETFDYEVVSSFPNLPQQERILNPFFVTRNIGVKISQVLANHRMTFSAGAFNDWWVTADSFKASGTDFSARLTGLVCDQPETRRFLHLGIAGRYAGADDNILRYKGQPESHVADDYVDTGDIPSDHAWHLGLEALWSEGPFSVLSEYNRAWVRSSETGNPEFSGYYVTASWVLTGEARPYDRTTGYARRIIPRGRWGAPELVARFSHLDLDDKAVQGGKLAKTYVGINWWATRRWKLGFGWGHTWLDRFGKTGITDSFLTRMQWSY